MSSGGGGGLSKLGISLVIIFAIALLAIFAQVFYIIWRRLAFRRRTSAASGGGDGISRYSSSESTPSKELLYFFCVRPQLDLDRTSPVAISGGVDGRNSNRESDAEVIDIDLFKIQGVFGPPRFLFTIKEEEREGTESPAPCPAEDEKRGGVSLEECFRSEEETAVEVKIDDCSRDDDATPFSTPCASPLYFTPTASPVHAVVNGRSTWVATTIAV
ncbi:hypothetical protein SASPL_138487 [Salvia splendens]|uniref:Uncharacterized protein n=1 Tax=Salvia splendens TaxID=180675 RepID=A0A8X8ZEF3_SALSN|nr:uncharacterized protein LOC121764396 [Salvia splendens]KAG6401623.1 hypothetical protein SASPL_138487 [Salvia splendens]